MVVADQDPRETLKVALQDLDSQALHTLMVAAYDRWCWESASEMDKDWYEVADELLRERGIMSSSSSSLNFGSGNGIGTPMLTLEQTPQDITMKANKLKFETPNNPVDYDVIDCSSDKFELGFDLKQAIVELITKEAQSGSITGNAGTSLQNQLEMLISGQISMAEWAIRPMIDRAIEEYDAKRKAEEGS